MGTRLEVALWQLLCRTWTRSRIGVLQTVSKLLNFIDFIGKDTTDLKKVMGEPEFKKLVMDEIAALSKEHKLSGLEKPKDIYLTDDAFTIENNLLTPTFKLKRNVVREYFSEQIKAMYAKLDFWEQERAHNWWRKERDLKIMRQYKQSKDRDHLLAR